MVEAIELFAPARSSVVRLTLDGLSPEYYPSFPLGVHITDDSFTGVATFWVTISEWRTFFAGLLECERTRRGEITLGEVSDWDSYLALKSMNSLGHFVLQYRLTHGATSLSGAFPLDRDYFGQIVSGLQRLDEAVQSNNR